MNEVAGDAEEEEVLAADEVNEELMEAVEDLFTEDAGSWIKLDDGVELLDEWATISDSAIEDITNSAMSGIDKKNFVDFDLLDADLGLGVEDSAVSAIDGASEALSGLGDGFLDFSAGNLEMLGIETAEMSTEELIAAGLAADLGLVVAA